MSFLNDWQFWSIVVSTLAIISSFGIYFLQRKKRRLAYWVLTDTPLLSVDEEIKGKIEIKYDGRKIQNIHLLILSLENIGNDPVASKDFEKPIMFSFPRSEILSIEITALSPNNFLPIIDHDDTTITIHPLLFNRKDYIEWKVLFTKYGKEINVYSRIVGVNGIQKVRKPKAIKRGTVLGLSFLFAFLTTGIIFFQMKLDLLVGILLFIPITILGMIVYIFMIFGVLGFYNNFMRIS